LRFRESSQPCHAIRFDSLIAPCDPHQVQMDVDQPHYFQLADIDFAEITTC